MVIDHIQNHSQAQAVRVIHEGTQIIRVSVQPRWCEKIHAIVSPAEPPREIRHGHELKSRDADVHEFGQVLHRCTVSAFR